MKTLTVTFHHSNNYGAILQAYALQQAIESFGHENLIFEYPYSEHFYDSIDWIRPALAIKTVCINILKFCRRKQIRERQNSFTDFHNRRMKLTQIFHSMDELRLNVPHCDALITGSDQVWRFSANKEFVPAYFLDFGEPGTLKFSYAASIEKLDYTSEQKALVTNWLKDYKAISLRETSAAEYIRNVTGYDTQRVLDPVFLLDRDHWMKIAKPPRIKEKYILCYQVQSSSTMQEIADYLKRMTGYKTVAVLPYSTKWIKTDYALFDVSPEEFLGLYNSAEMVVSGSFHGTALAHVFGKTVYASVKEGHANRIVDIMSLLGVPQFCIGKTEDLLPPGKFDHKRVQEILQAERLRSMEYLRNCLL